MPRRLLLALLLLVAAPLVLLGWLSATTMANSQERARTQLTALLRSRLSEIDRSAIKLFEGYSRHLNKELVQSDNVINRLRELRRTDPIVRQGIFVSSDGQLLHPPKPNPDDADAVALYAALPGMISGRSDFAGSADYDASQLPGSSQARKSIPSKQESLLEQIASAKVNALRGRQRSAVLSNVADITPESYQWQVWYMDRGIQLIYWLPRQDGAAIGVLLDRPRWTSDLTAELPDSTPTNRGSAGASDADFSNTGFTALVDESKQTVYRWGEEGARADKPIAAVPMSEPLSAWHWEFHRKTPLVPSYSTLPIVASLMAIGLLLLGLGGYVLTSVQRQMHAARNRVSFAGQVSHELRTPLTNIRLYAELAQDDLDEIAAGEQRDKLSKRLGVIDSESKRLSRLVSGVLEMIRDGKNNRGPRLEPHHPDDLVEETLCHFTPSFEKLGIQIERNLNASALVKLDADIVEMVLVNLLSNVEKYAAEGKYVKVDSRIEDNQFIVSVSDRGPGISRRHHGKIFQPFSRLDNSISAPSGTGIGLAIARNAARRHDGEIRLVPSETGAHFEFRVAVEVVESPGPSSKLIQK
ncbi:MAG: HAMP domain-containing sensor histidine kinase [Pirellulaceae bacterium]